MSTFGALAGLADAPSLAHASRSAWGRRRGEGRGGNKGKVGSHFHLILEEMRGSEPEPGVYALLCGCGLCATFESGGPLGAPRPGVAFVDKLELFDSL